MSKARKTSTISPLLLGDSHKSLDTDRLRIGDSRRRRAGVSAIRSASFQGSKSRSFLPFFTIALLLAISFCVGRWMSPLGKGMRRRRLSAGGEDSKDADDIENPPGSPDYSDLCAELGAWNPSESPPGEPRSSPALIDAFFMSLEPNVSQEVSAQKPPSADFPFVPFAEELQPADLGDGAAQQPVVGSDPLSEFSPVELPRLSPKLIDEFFRSIGHSALEQPSTSTSLSPDASAFVAPSTEGSAKRPLDDDESNDGGGGLGPSWKVAKTLDNVQRAPGATQELVASAGSSSLAAAQAAPEPTPSAPALRRRRRSCPLEEHPYVRLPSLAPGVRTRQFSEHFMKSSDHTVERHCGSLLRLREQLRKPILNEAEAYLLLYYSEEAANHAYLFMQDRIDMRRPIRAANQLGRRLVTVYSLFCASQVLKQDWVSKPWWRELMSRIVHEYPTKVSEHNRVAASNVSLSIDLSAAIEKLKNGDPLPPATIVDLLRRLFCLPNSPYLFRERLWDPWRQDDEEEDSESSESH
ncbi:hypothetical protein Emag_005151 [Eimeria magna]